jgi:hypothetical protein
MGCHPATPKRCRFLSSMGDLRLAFEGVAMPAYPANTRDTASKYGHFIIKQVIIEAGRLDWRREKTYYQ